MVAFVALKKNCSVASLRCLVDLKFACGLAVVLSGGGGAHVRKNPQNRHRFLHQSGCPSWLRAWLREWWGPGGGVFRKSLSQNRGLCTANFS
jgi:hypothetical protein